MKRYDIIAVGTGSAMSIISAVMSRNPNLKIAVIEKDQPGGICLTRGCIPSKMLLYPADVVRTIDSADRFGIKAKIDNIDFKAVMDRMRDHINPDIENIRRGLTHARNLDYYPYPAEFVEPYVLKVNGKKIKGEKILLCTGSEIFIPPIMGLAGVDYLTSDTILGLNELPRSVVIIGGGYIGAEYGHFLSSMGSKVTIIGRNTQFLKQEEPEISAVALYKMKKQMRIFTQHEVTRVERSKDGRIKVIADHKGTGKLESVTADAILVASSRAPNTALLKPENSGIDTDKRGWIKVNEKMETSMPNIWAFGDATGKHLFKHAANHEAAVVYYNAFGNAHRKADYHAVPHAVFTHPEIAGVGMGEAEALVEYGLDGVLIGFQRFEDTAKGSAMGLKDCFVKIIAARHGMKILGAHIIGPQASVLIQEIINLMYTKEGSLVPVVDGMHIHPALSEVVERAGGNLMSIEDYHHMLGHQLGHVPGIPDPHEGSGGHGHGHSHH